VATTARDSSPTSMLIVRPLAFSSMRVLMYAPSYSRATLTGMRSGELTGALGASGLERRVLTVGRAKTSAGTGRQIPMNNDLFLLLTALAEWSTERFGETRPEY